MSRRVAIGVHEITRVLAGEQTIFLRPHSSFFSRVMEGEKLWIAEPFFLAKQFDGLAPTAARTRGAVPAFAADHAACPSGHGQRHPARSLCREWHRAHIVITDRTELLVQDLADVDLVQFGFATRSAFAAHWDQQAALVGVTRFKVQHNPRVLRFGFRLVRRPITFAPRPTPKTRAAEPAVEVVAPPPEAVAPVRAVVAPPRLAVAPSPPASAERVTPAPVAPKIGHVKPGPEFPVEAAASHAKGDKAFLAALRRDPTAGHTSPIRSSAPPRQRIIPSPLPATGTCPCCGTRLAFGCEHHPRQETAA